MRFTIRDLLWLTVVACVIAASIGRGRVMTAKVARVYEDEEWLADKWANDTIELIDLRRAKASRDWFWSGKPDSEYDGPTYPIQRNPTEEEKGPLKADRSSWDVHERIHDHMSAFHGIVQAKTAEEATAAAKLNYGQKVHVVPYERQGFAAPLSDYDLGCYRQ